jgi:Zn-finger domain-containing protein
MNESVLIGRAEKFLSGIRRKTINADDIHDLNSFMDIYINLKDNLYELQEYRDTMEIKGYKAPYSSLMKFGRVSSVEMKVEDLHDISRHTQHFRMRAALKKNILDRVKSSIASHKIAIGNLEEFATIKCLICNRDYTGHEIADLTVQKCNCGSQDLELNINYQGIYRLKIIKYLPLSGEYMVKMSELSPFGRDAFRQIVRILKQEKRGLVKTVSMVVKVLEGGRWVRKRVNLDCSDQLNYEKEIRKKYGSNARIEFLQFHRKKPSIVNDKHVQNALALGYVKFSEKQSENIIPVILDKNLKNSEKLEKYDEILKNARLTGRRMGEDTQDQKTLEKELITEELVKEGLIRKGLLDNELQEDLSCRKKIEEKLLVDAPRILILWDILKYYLSTSYDRRSKYSGPFPNLRPVLDKTQINTFTDFPESLVECLKEYSDEKIGYIYHMNELLNEKFDLEKKLKGLHLKLNIPALGAVILHNVGKLSIKESSEIFSLTIDEVINEKDKLQTFQKPVTRKAQKFLEMIKD